MARVIITSARTISFAHNDIVNEMPMSRARVHPCGLTFVRLLKHGVGYDKLVLCAGGEEQSTV